MMRKNVEIPVVIVAEKNYRDINNSWRKEAEQMIEAVNGIFQKEFQIKLIFQINSFIEWIVPSIIPFKDWGPYQGYQKLKIRDKGLEKELYRLWSQYKLSTIIKKVAEEMGGRNLITIILISDPEVPQIPPGISMAKKRNKFNLGGNPETPYCDFPEDHFTRIPESYILIRMNSENPTNVLVHEMAAVFGAKHTSCWGKKYVEQYPSVMNPEEVFKTTCFDPRNRSIVSKNIKMLLKNIGF